MNGGTALVTFVTPVYNGALYLETLIQSVLTQNYPKIEHIIIDDGSTDNGATMAVLKRHAHLRWWSRSNQGQYATMNEGLAAARGDIICFVSADDVICPNAVNQVVKFLADHPEIDAVYGDIDSIDERGDDLPVGHPLRWAPTCFYPFSTHIAHCSLYIHKASLTEHHLYFNPELRYTGDYDWILRILRSTLRIGRLHRSLSKLRRHSEQSSIQNRSAIHTELRNIQKKYGINPLLFYWTKRLYALLYWSEEFVWALKNWHFKRFFYLVRDRFRRILR